MFQFYDCHCLTPISHSQAQWSCSPTSEGPLGWFSLVQWAVHSIYKLPLKKRTCDHYNFFNVCYKLLPNSMQSILTDFWFVHRSGECNTTEMVLKLYQLVMIKKSIFMTVQFKCT